MRNSFLIAKNVLRSVLKKKSSFIIFLVIPILCVLLSLTLYSSSGTGSSVVGIEDNDKSTISTDMVKTMNGNDKFKMKSIEDKDVKSSIVSQKVDCVLVIPKGFEDSIRSGSAKKFSSYRLRVKALHHG